MLSAKGSGFIKLVLAPSLCALIGQRLCEKPYRGSLLICPADDSGPECDLFCADETPLLSVSRLHARAAILPDSFCMPPHTLFTADTAINCGMSAADTVSFSSINGEKALLFVSRPVSWEPVRFEPMTEFKVPYFSALSVYRNLAINLCSLLLDAFFESEGTQFELFSDKRSSPRAHAWLP